MAFAMTSQKTTGGVHSTLYYMIVLNALNQPQSRLLAWIETPRPRASIPWRPFPGKIMRGRDLESATLHVCD